MLWDDETGTPGAGEETWRNGLTDGERDEIVDAIEDRIPDCSVILPAEDRPAE